MDKEVVRKAKKIERKMTFWDILMIPIEFLLSLILLG